MSALLSILEPKAFALPTSHRTDNAYQPTPVRTIFSYIETHLRRRLGCHLSAVMLRVCEVLGSQRQTFENVFSYNKTARSPTMEPTSDAAKLRINYDFTKQIARFLRHNMTNMSKNGILSHEKMGYAVANFSLLLFTLHFFYYLCIGN